MIYNNILETIGKTPVVRLNRDLSPDIVMPLDDLDASWLTFDNGPGFGQGTGSCYGDGGGLDNAFLRCYWSALLARDIGLEDARDFFEIHPARLGASPDEAQRDLRNSSIGLSIGRSHPGASNATLADRCAWALEFGRLQLAAPRRAALYSAVRQ